jgi:hypothetical protein
MVIASRYLDGASSEDDTRLTAIGNWGLTRLINTSGRFKYTDALVMFRAYRKNIIEQLGFTRPMNGLQQRLAKMTGLYSWEPSLSIRANRAGMRISEIGASEPKAFRERRQNTLVHGTAIGTQILHELARRI